jgi:hypothetical protein
METTRPDIYEFIGTYANSDARTLLEAFMGAGIDYTLDIDKIGLENMSPVQAAFGGTYGAGVGIAIGVQIDDLDEAISIQQQVLKILP